MRLLRPTEAEFLSLFNLRTREILMCSPWISAEGVTYLRRGFEACNPNRVNSIEIWLRMNRKDHEAGLTDYRNLSSLLQDIQARAPKINIAIWQSDNLHAKCYITERGAIIG